MLMQRLASLISQFIITASNSDTSMKNLKAITHKMQKVPSNSIYIAESVLKEMNLSRVDYVEVRWAGQTKENVHSTIEQKSFIQASSNILNESKRYREADVQAYDQPYQRKCLFKIQYRYYTVGFAANEAQFGRMRNFLLSQISSLINSTKVNEQNKLAVLFLEKLNELGGINNYPKVTIRLIDRYDHNLMPFVSNHSKKHVLKCLAQKSINDHYGTLKGHTESSSLQMDSEMLVMPTNSAMFQEKPEQRSNRLGKKTLAVSKEKIVQGQTQIKRSSIDLAINSKHNVQEEGGNQNRNIEINQPKQSPKRKNDSRVRFHSAIEPLSSTKFFRMKVFIQEHNIDEKSMWTFKGQKQGQTFLLAERELVEQGFEKEVKNYKKMVAGNQAKQSKDV